MADSRKSRSRIVVETQGRHYQPRPGRSSNRGIPEIWAALSIIAAALLATFLALYITSRPFDPMNATVAPQQTVPAGPSLTPSPKVSPTMSPTPTVKPTAESSPVTSETAAPVIDDATIQANIEKALAADSVVAAADVSTLVENGRVTIVGSVKSAEIRQHVERTIRSVKGVTGVEDQLVITAATP